MVPVQKIVEAPVAKRLLNKIMLSEVTSDSIILFNYGTSLEYKRHIAKLKVTASRLLSIARK